MCAVSNVGDYYGRQWGVPGLGGSGQGPTLDWATKQDLAKLEHEVLEMKRLLIAAKEIDTKVGNKDCEMEEKIKTLKAVAKLVGVSLDDVFNPTASAAGVQKDE
jgi:hypothetical protein